MNAISFVLMSLAAAGAPEDGCELLYFNASWCGPCQQMNPTVEKLRKEGYPIRIVDVDDEPEMTKQYNVSTIPNFVLIQFGREVEHFIGSTTEARLRSLLTMNLSEHSKSAVPLDATTIDRQLMKELADLTRQQAKLRQKLERMKTKLDKIDARVGEIRKRVETNGTREPAED